jgi:DNA-binding Xre family transcriptional regulator
MPLPEQTSRNQSPQRILPMYDPTEPAPDSRLPQQAPTGDSRGDHQALRTAVIEALRAQGIILSEPVVCIAGEPDIVTASHDAIYSVHSRLTRDRVCAALGELMLYRACINPHARTIIVGHATPEALVLRPLIASLGVEVMFWGNAPQPIVLPSAERQPPATYHQPTEIVQPVQAPPGMLTWDITSQADRRGIASVPQLAAQLGIGRQGLYGLWRGEAAQISLEMLGRLAHALDAHPGDWFSWQEQSTGRVLVWNVRSQSEARKIDRVALGFKAALHQNSIVPIWEGTAQAVQLSSLARIARALDTPEQPFNVGELLRWKIDN